MDLPIKFEDDNIIEWTVRTLVRDRCTPELEELYVQLNAALIAGNCTVHFDELDLQLARLNDQNVDPVEIVQDVDECLRMAAERGLNICGIEFIPDIPLPMLIEAVDIILNFDPTDTPTILVDVLNAAEDADQALISILEYLGTYEADEWLIQLLEVSSSFTKNILRVCKDAAAADEVVEIDATTDGALLKRLSRLVRNNKTTLGAELGASNVGLGISTESLYASYINRIIDKPVGEAIGDIFSLAVISNESYEVAMESVSRCVDDLFYEIDDRRQAEQHRLKLAESYKPFFGGSDA